MKTLARWDHRQLRDDMHRPLARGKPIAVLALHFCAIATFSLLVSLLVTVMASAAPTAGVDAQITGDARAALRQGRIALLRDLWQRLGTRSSGGEMG